MRSARLLIWWDAVRVSYWFVPCLLLALGAGLAVGMIALDHRVETETLRGLWWVFGGGPDGARSMLSTIAGSVMTVAGVVFSITVAALSLTSQQFGPRLLRNFLRDTGNQAALGTFLSTFLYCLIVLRTVRSVAEVRFVPHLAVTLGQALAVASVFVLVYFIHNVATSIQAGHLVREAGRELEHAVERIFPDRLGAGGRGADAPARPERLPLGWREQSAPVPARESGHVQALDEGALLALASEGGALVEVLRRPGEFVTAGTPLARVSPPGRADDEEFCGRLRGALTIGDGRTPAQDVEMAVQQLVEVAVRSLSPGINDPFTACECLDRLGVGLSELARRALPPPCRYDGEGRLRLVLNAVTFESLCDSAFTQIRHYGRGDVLVLTRLLRVMEDVASALPEEERRVVLRRQAERTRRAAAGLLGDESEGATDALSEQHRAAMAALGGERRSQRPRPVRPSEEDSHVLR